jgi:3-hydroxyacyl-CoA dehydrogenase
MERRLQRAAVLGAGVMGAAIAAHLANVGLDVYLLDIIPDEATLDPSARNRLAEQAKKQLQKQKPSPIYTKEVLNRIHPGNLEDHLSVISDCDWVIEAVVENLAVKKDLWKRLEVYWKPGTIVSSNTSGISIQGMVEGRSQSFQSHFLGTHFFNPPRYMKLLEIIPTPATNPEIIAVMNEFCTYMLGKGVVIAKDTPNFIANRIGVFGLLVTLKEMEAFKLSVSEVDALTGPILGRPKSATFRTLDMVGLDTFVHVARNVYEQVEDEREKNIFAVPEWLDEMVKTGRLGNKTGQGFYWKKKNNQVSEILQLDITSGEYIPVVKKESPLIEAVKSTKGIESQIKKIAFSADPAGQFVWNVLKQVLLYSAEKIPEIADDLAAIDLAMKWGFNWELGPFETWDSLGLTDSIARMEKEGERIPDWIQDVISSGRTCLYEKTSQKKNYCLPNGQWKAITPPDQTISLLNVKNQNKIIHKNAGASLIDLGDDVACLEFHSPNNVIGQDILQMVRYSLDEVRKNYRGLVIGSEGKNFCVGANLMMLLMEAQDENWFEIEQMVRDFQSLSMSIKYFEKPVVSAPYAMTLGGGVEMCLPASHVLASAETYMGLVEVGVGLIPAGAGTKEMLVRTILNADVNGKNDLQPFVGKVFETIAMAKVSTSGAEAKELGYLRPSDQIIIRGESQLYKAKQAVLTLSTSGYQPPEKRKIRVIGEPGLAVLKLAVYQLKTGGQISDHDARIANRLAHVLSGGSITSGSYVSEEYLLELEREAFLSLCGEPKTQARMQYMLLKGKPLRN